MKKEASQCILCSKDSYNKETIEVHYWKVHRDSGLSVKLIVVDMLVVKYEKRNSKIIITDIIQCKEGVGIIWSRKS